VLNRVRAARPAVLLTLLATAVTLLAGPVPTASAHAELIATSPAAGARVATAPAVVTLTFTDPIDARYVRLAVTTPSGRAVSGFTTAGPVVRITVSDRSAGAYRVEYRVVSKDGHPVSGRLDYTVLTGPGPAVTPPASAGATTVGAAPSPSPSSSASPLAPRALVASAPPGSGPGPGAGSGPSSAAWLAGGAGLLVVLVAAGFGVRAARRGRPGASR